LAKSFSQNPSISFAKIDSIKIEQKDNSIYNQLLVDEIFDSLRIYSAINRYSYLLIHSKSSGKLLKQIHYADLIEDKISEIYSTLEQKSSNNSLELRKQYKKNNKLGAYSEIELYNLDQTKEHLYLFCRLNYVSTLTKDPGIEFTQMIIRISKSNYSVNYYLYDKKSSKDYRISYGYYKHQYIIDSTSLILPLWSYSDTIKEAKVPIWGTFILSKNKILKKDISPCNLPLFFLENGLFHSYNTNYIININSNLYYYYSFLPFIFSLPNCTSYALSDSLDFYKSKLSTVGFDTVGYQIISHTIDSNYLTLLAFSSFTKKCIISKYAISSEKVTKVSTYILPKSFYDSFTTLELIDSKTLQGVDQRGDEYYFFTVSLKYD
jgi:hypothetical protein